MGRCPTNYEKGLNNMEKSALTNITEKLTQSEKIFVSDLKLLAGEARRQAYAVQTIYWWFAIGLSVGIS